MAVFNIPDIYGRFYLVNFDNVKVISLAENKECGDLLFEFNDRTRMVISAGLDRRCDRRLQRNMPFCWCETSQLNEVLYEYAILR